jgi:hypothetical protein
LSGASTLQTNQIAFVQTKERKMSTLGKTAVAIFFVLALAFAAKFPWVGAHAQQPATGAEQGAVDVYQMTVQAKNLPRLDIDEAY